MNTGLNAVSLLFGAVVAGLLSVPAASADEHVGAPVTQAATVTADTQIGTAAAHLRDGQWEAAFAILRPLAASDPRAGELLFESDGYMVGALGAER